MKKLKRLIYLKLARRLSKSTTGAPVPSIVSENTKIIGNIISDGIIHIDGHVEGDVSCDELIIGIKGCGKGTLVSGLEKHYDISLISMGQLLRDEISTGSNLGKTIKETIDRGELVSTDIVVETLKKKLDETLSHLHSCLTKGVKYSNTKYGGTFIKGNRYIFVNIDYRKII